MRTRLMDSFFALEAEQVTEIQAAAIDIQGESLNAGFELDNELALAEVPLGDELPDLSVEFSEMTALEHRIQDIAYLQTDIARAQGMMQSFALEAEKLLPGFQRVPLGYYTELPTATRLKVSLEELSRGAWGLIAAGVAALLVMLGKIFSWFSGSKGEGGKGGAKEAQAAADKAGKVAEAIPTVLEDTSKIVQHAEGLLQKAQIKLRDAHGNEVACDSFQVVIDRFLTDDERYARAKKILETTDPLFYDMLHHGALSKLMHNVANRLPAINHVLHDRINVLDEVAKLDLNQPDDPDAKATNSLRLKQQESGVNIQIDGKSLDLDGIVKLLHDTKQETLAKKVEGKLYFDSVFTAISKAYRSEDIQGMMRYLGESMRILAELEERLNKLQALTRDLSTDGINGASSQDIARHISAVVFSVRKDVHALGMLVHHLRSYAAAMEYLVREALGIAKEVVRKLTDEMRKNKQDAGPEWTKVTKDIADQIHAINHISKAGK